jgi:hypothetical protein
MSPETSEKGRVIALLPQTVKRNLADFGLDFGALWSENCSWKRALWRSSRSEMRTPECPWEWNNARQPGPAPIRELRRLPNRRTLPDAYCLTLNVALYTLEA